MASKTTQKQEDKKGPGPLLSLMMLFGDADAAAELFRKIRWINDLTCPECHRKNVTKYCKYRKYIQRYICKDYSITFNDKTGTLLHYRRIEVGSWLSGCTCAGRSTARQ